MEKSRESDEAIILMNDDSLKNRRDRSYVPWYRRCIPSWRTVAIGLLLLCATPFAIRWYRLSLLPDVPVPFDVDEFLDFPYVEDENAYRYFQRAAAMGQGIRKQEPLHTPFVQQGKTFAWKDVPADIQPWVAKGSAALAIFRQGARCPAGSFHVPREGYNATVPLPSVRLHELCWLALLESQRLLEEDRPQDAAEVLHDLFRISRLWGNGGWLNQRYNGIYFHQLAAIGWHEWARHPHVAESDLETALQRLRQDWKLTLPVSDILKVDLLTIMNEAKLPLTLLRKEWHADVDRWWQQHIYEEPIKGYLNAWETYCPGWQLPILWTLGEPDIMRRGAKLHLLHELKTCDLPLARQPPEVESSFSSFHLSRTDDLTAGLSAEQLQARFQLSPLMGHMGNTSQDLQLRLWSEAAQQTLLEAEFQLQMLYRRQQVRSRADAEAVLVTFAWPVDPCSPIGASLQFRTTEEGLLIWSLGLDRADQQGVSILNNYAVDLLLLIPWPTDPLSENTSAG